MNQPYRQSGVGLFAAIFLIAVLAAVGTSFALIANSQQISSARSLTLTRAYYAARAGVDEAIFTARFDENCNNVDGTTTTVDGIDVELECNAPPEIQESDDKYKVFTLTATAVKGSRDSGTRVRRRLKVQTNDS